MSADAHPPPAAASRRWYHRDAPMMEEYTPASSVNEEDVYDRRLQFWAGGRGKLVLRATNAALHLALCGVLFAIMAQFMMRYTGHRRRPQAIALLTVLAVDCCLDLYSVVRLRKSWQSCAVVVRLLLALGYIAQFLLYVGYRCVFPPQYAFWGMRAGFSEPVVYMFLLALGIWDMFQVTIHRHILGRDLHLCINMIQARSYRRSQGSRDDANGVARTASTDNQQRTSSLTHVESGANSEATIALGDVRADDKSPRVAVMRQSGASSTCGESSPQGGSAVHIDCQPVTPRVSRKTSTVPLDAAAKGEGQTE